MLWAWGYDAGGARMIADSRRGSCSWRMAVAMMGGDWALVVGVAAPHRLKREGHCPVGYNPADNRLFYFPLESWGSWDQDRFSAVCTREPKLEITGSQINGLPFL